MQTHFSLNQVLAQIPREDFSRENEAVLKPHRQVPSILSASPITAFKL